MSLMGHVRTMAAFLWRWWRPPTPPPSVEWVAFVDDPLRGRVRLTGRLTEIEGAEGLVVLVHGLGGCAESSYLVNGARACKVAGLSCLRLNLRGADRRGEDVYHAGLTADLRAAVTSEVARSYSSVWVIGYSMGGHIALRMVAEGENPGVEAIAAICPPIDLAATAELLDQPSRWPYRAYLLRQLGDIYAAVARRHPEGPSPKEVASARSFVDFDSLVVAPRYGFQDARDYYRQASVGPLLGRLRVPSLVVAAVGDPMVPAASLRRALENSPNNLKVLWSSSAGHLAFPRSSKLVDDGGGALESQIVRWLRRQRDSQPE